ncbi:peptidoglycan-binding protein [Streptacidiphilus sp. N1-3]|uniref:Peptidoglycan-binding protein n=1 Tax=Streptacidiphilus alkalitolerans TaxID=3342712 RepID=A0ABV6WZF6_9ACTN
MGNESTGGEAGNAAAGGTGVLVRRRRLVLAAALAAVAVSGGGLTAAGFVQSPAQAAADTRAPRPSVLTAPVQLQVLRSTVVLRGTFSNGRTVSSLPSSVATTSATAPGAGAALMVTGVFVHQDQKVAAGVPLVEYSGRPVFVLPGEIPAYRDLLPGATGKDVVQLQKALESLGYSTTSDNSGTFGHATKMALTRLYEKMGYPPPVTGAATAATVKAARQRVDALRSQAAQASVRIASTGTASSAAGAPAAADGSPTQGSIKHQLAQAEEDLAQASALDGTMLPASEVVFVPSLPARVVSVPVAVGDPVKGPVVTLARGAMQLTGMLDPSDQGLVKAGMSVQVLSETSGLQTTGTIDSVGSLVTPGAAGTGTADPGGAAVAGTGGAYLPLRIKPVHSWDSRLAGQDVRITLTAASTSGAVLAVPEAAVLADAQARTAVTVQDPSGAQRTVTVTTGVSADGMVQVTPTSGTLHAGDRVVVGQ